MKHTDMTKTDATRAVIEGMVDGLDDHRIADVGEFFEESFRWLGKQLRHQGRPARVPGQPAEAVPGGLKEQGLHRRGAALHGEWAAAFGRQEATHAGEFMGIAPTGKRVEVRYMDFWKVVHRKITDNWVMVDFPHVMAQLGVNAFGGHGRASYERGEKTPPTLDLVLDRRSPRWRSPTGAASWMGWSRRGRT